MRSPERVADPAVLPDPGNSGYSPRRAAAAQSSAVCRSPEAKRRMGTADMSMPLSLGLVQKARVADDRELDQILVGQRRTRESARKLGQIAVEIRIDDDDEAGRDLGRA